MKIDLGERLPYTKKSLIPANEGDNRSPGVALAGVHAPDVGNARTDHAVGDLAFVAVAAVARCVAVRVGDDGHVGLVEVNLVKIFQIPVY